MITDEFVKVCQSVKTDIADRWIDVDLSTDLDGRRGFYGAAERI